MTPLQQALAKILARSPDTLVLSVPRDKGADAPKATLRRVEEYWQQEQRRGAQMFHTNYAEAELLPALEALLETQYRELHALGPEGESHLRISKKGKILHSHNTTAIHEKRPEGHNRQKNFLLPEGRPIPALAEMGVFTSTGQVAAGMQGKYRQVNRFVELVDDLLGDAGLERISAVDFGCGKSTLTFVLYHYLANILGVQARVTGIDQKREVIDHCNAAAQKYGYGGLSFAAGDVAAYRPGAPVDMVVALHACDTATDVALARAVEWGSRFIFSAPCCQHELNGQMAPGPLPILARYGVVQERTAALMTDALRANLLTACGYKTQLLEFVDLAHTPKNLLIRAKKAALPLAVRRAALDEVTQLTEAFGFAPTLLELLRTQGALEDLAEK